MSDFLKSQVEARNNLIEQARTVIESAEADKRGLTVDDQATIERIETEISQRDAAIDTAKKMEEREARAIDAARNSFVPSNEVRGDADILRAIANGEMRSHTFGTEKRTLVPSDNTVPKSFFDEVFSVARQAGPMLNVAQVINTASGEQLTIPTLTAYSTATIKGAGSAISDSEPTFSSITLNAFKYSFLVPVANELLTDAGFDISALIAEQAGNAIGFGINTGLTVGTGTVEPTGIFTTGASAVTGGTGVSGAPTYENLVDLLYALDGQARLLPGVGWLMNKTGLAAVRKIKDGSGAFIWSAGNIAQGQPDQLLGYPVYENPAAANVATGAFSIGVGHLPSLKARVAGGIQVAQSADYAFNEDVTTFRVTARVDSKLTHASHFVKFRGGAS
ncbi:COG4653 Predicted phage phi-C31 gp36 major capsid-like protein [uncultured Caudovirales phage]|jgi:HK97 family phage major capsid protein|uniref:COG4653 Predicted phage phi-C31 gp36 major capsid-like protein n=1 Tax=uncultured Caudovirales phage TaxID=2100421 RepID=A0A6J5NF88_9CAUD|nr:COG4653 Predicted phage phi-C31 gp36 major capsid-like protein [uncultured Caudovirales phage]